MTDKFFQWLAVIFLLLTAAFFLLRDWLLQSLGADYAILLGGNAALAIITFISYSLNRKGLTSDNPNVFVRSVYSSTLAKLMLCIVCILVYVFLNRDHVSKATIFLFLFMYLVYTVFETLRLYRRSVGHKKS
ncbi:hypothetical protein ACWKWU_05385 [Chitinophaga lutea]